MRLIIRFFSALFAAFSIGSGILFPEDFNDGKWHQTFHGIRGGNLCEEYTMVTKNMKIKKVQLFEDITSGGGLLLEYCDTTYINKMVD